MSTFLTINRPPILKNPLIVIDPIGTTSNSCPTLGHRYPAGPGGPNGPGGPDTPGKPGGPIGPGGPGGPPSCPGSPGSPGSPFGPGAPGGPGGPKNPSDPVGPGGPGGPSLPCGPGGPGGPTIRWAIASKMSTPSTNKLPLTITLSVTVKELIEKTSRSELVPLQRKPIQ